MLSEELEQKRKRVQKILGRKVGDVELMRIRENDPDGPAMAAHARKQNEIISVDVSEKHVDKIARGYIVGSTAVGKRKDLRMVLEKRVVDTIGKKGKMLVDKLFELIEGVYVVDRVGKTKFGDEIRYYKVPPNLNAIIYALDRVLGKPKQVSLSANFSLSQLLVGRKDGPVTPSVRENERDMIEEALNSKI